MTTTNNIGAQGVSWAVFGAECLQCVTDLRWMIILAVVMIGTDFYWGVQELAMKRKRAERTIDKERYRFHFSQAGRRTLNKAVDYLTYLLVGCVAGLAITEPMGIADHTTTAAVGLGFGCLFELSSIVGHIAACKGINIKLNLKQLIVAIVRKKNEDVADILDSGIDEIEDNRRPAQMDDYGIDKRHYGRRGDCSISATYDDYEHHCGQDVEQTNEENDEDTEKTDEGV